MKTCPKCHAANDEAKKFCRACGSPLAPAAAYSPEVTAKRQIFEGRLAANGPSPGLLGEYADYLASQGLHQEALAQYQAASRLAPQDRALLLKIVEAHKALGQWDQAAVQLLLMIESAPRDLALKEALVAVYLGAGRRQEALKTLGQMSELDPGNADLLRLRRDLLGELGQTQELTQVCSTTVGLDPGDAETWLMLARLRQEAGQPAQAREAAEGALRAQPGNPQANLALGVALHDLGQEAERAKEALSAALEAPQGLDAQEQALARVHLASLGLTTGGQPGEALEALNAVTAIPPAAKELYAQTYLRAGDALQGQGDEAGAMSAWQACLERTYHAGAKERLGRAHAAQGQALAAQGKHAQAAEAYETSLRYLSQDPEMEDALFRSRKAARGRRTLKASLAAAAALILSAGAGWYFYAMGAYDIAVSPPAKASVLRGQEVVTAAQGEEAVFKTGMLRTGSYTLRLEKEGYETLERPLEIGLGRETKSERLVMRPRWGEVRVGSIPAGATVTLTSRYEKKTARTPAVFKNVFAIPTKIEVSAPGFLPYRTEQTPTQGQTLDLGQISFTGTLQIESDPPGAEVLVGGVARGITPATIKDLPARAVEVELNKKGAGSFAGTVEVQPQQTTKAGPFKLAQVGSLQVDSSPSGATLSLDGQQVGKTPHFFKTVPAGEHTLKVETANCLPATKKVVVEAGKRNEAGTIQIGECTGLRLNSDPPGARVVLDGREMGAAPFTTNQIAPGEHTVKVEAANCLPVTKKVVLELGKRLDLGTVAVSECTTLKLNSDPAGAKVFINGAEIGQTPLNKSQVQAGEVAVRLETANCVANKRVNLELGKNADLGIIPIRDCTVFQVTSYPVGAKVFIDTNEVGQTPLVLNEPPLGKRTVRLELTSLGTVQVRSVLIEKGQTMNLGIVDMQKVTIDGVVTDISSGLQWIAGPDRDVNYMDAVEWVRRCQAGGGGWRMPTRTELHTLYQKGVNRYNIKFGIKFSGLDVWAEPLSNTHSYIYSFRDGRGYSDHTRNSVSARAFGVRSIPSR